MQLKLEDLKEQYLNKIKNEKKYLRFQQLDIETQLMICKIDGFSGFGNDNGFFDKLLEMFEGKSMELMEVKKAIVMNLWSSIRKPLKRTV